MKKNLIRAILILFIIILPFALTFLFGSVGPWLDQPHENGPYLSWNSDPSTSIVISYETPQNVSTTLYWGINTSVSNIKSTTNQKIHAINLTSLLPNTNYYYKINSTEIDCHYMNKYYSFKTGLNPSNPGAFRFAVYGDNQLDIFGRSVHQRIVDRVITHDPDFVINTGDIVSTSEETNWDRFFYEVRNLASRKPYMISIGNHEQVEGANPDYGKHFRELFTFPNNDVYYSFNYSNACFIALNISVDEHRINLTERNWLLNTLEKANNSPLIDWIFVYYHVPLYSSGGHGCNQDLIDDYAQIFMDYKVDIIFSGHDHHYERMYVNGTYYFVNGGGGGMLDLILPWYQSRDWSQYKLLCTHYLIIDIDGDDLHLQSIREDGFVFDEIFLTSRRN